MIQKNDKASIDLFLEPGPQNSQNCSRFSNKNQSNDKHHLARDEHHQVCKNLYLRVSPTPRTKYTKYRASHSSAVLLLSINTHKHRTIHSSAMLLRGMSKIADLPRASTYSWHRTTNKFNTIMLLKYLRTEETA